MGPFAPTYDVWIPADGRGLFRLMVATSNVFVEDFFGKEQGRRKT